MSSPSNIVNAVLWCIMVVSSGAIAQVDVRSHYSVRFDTASIALLRTAWNGPLLLTRDPDSDKQVLGRFGSQSVSVVLRELPAHTLVNVSFEVAVIGSWDGDQDRDRLRVVVDGRDTVLNATFSNTTYRQSYPDRIGAATHRQRTGAFRQNTLGFKFVERDVYNGSLDATYLVNEFVPHTSDSVRIDVEGILRDLRPGIENESWALISFDVTCLSTSAKMLHKVPGIDTSFADDVFPGVTLSSEIVHDLRLPIAVLECAQCVRGCDAVSVAVYTDRTAAAWKKRIHRGEPTMAFELTSQEFLQIDKAIRICLADSVVRKHLSSVIYPADNYRDDRRDCTITIGLGEEAFTCSVQRKNPESLENLRLILREAFERHGWTGGP